METGQAEVTADLRPGGNFEMGMFNEKGEEECKPHGIYLEIVPPERVVFTWTSEGSVKDTGAAIERFDVRTTEGPNSGADSRIAGGHDRANIVARLAELPHTSGRPS